MRPNVRGAENIVKARKAQRGFTAQILAQSIRFETGGEVVELPLPTIRVGVLFEAKPELLDFDNDDLAVAKLVHILKSGEDKDEISLIAQGYWPDDLENYIAEKPLSYSILVPLILEREKGILNSLYPDSKNKSMFDLPVSRQAIIASLIELGINYNEVMDLRLGEAAGIVAGNNENIERMKKEMKK